MYLSDPTCPVLTDRSSCACIIRGDNMLMSYIMILQKDDENFVYFVWSCLCKTRFTSKVKAQTERLFSEGVLRE